MPDTKIACPYCAADGTSLPLVASKFFPHVFTEHSDAVFSKRPFHRTDNRGQLHNLKNPFHMIFESEKSRTADKTTNIKRFVCLGCYHSCNYLDKNRDMFKEHTDTCEMYRTAIENLRTKYPLAAAVAPEKKELDSFTASIHNLQQGSQVTDALTGPAAVHYNRALSEAEYWKKQADQERREAAKYKYMATQLFVHAAIGRKIALEDPKVYDKAEALKISFQHTPSLHIVDNPTLDDFFDEETNKWFNLYRLGSIQPNTFVEDFKRFQLSLLDIKKKKELEEFYNADSAAVEEKEKEILAKEANDEQE